MIVPFLNRFFVDFNLSKRVCKRSVCYFPAQAPGFLPYINNRHATSTRSEAFLGVYVKSSFSAQARGICCGPNLLCLRFFFDLDIHACMLGPFFCTGWWSFHTLKLTYTDNNLIFHRPSIPPFLTHSN